MPKPLSQVLSHHTHRQQQHPKKSNPKIDGELPLSKSDPNMTAAVPDDKPVFAPGTETIMRNQLVNVFNAKETQLLTTTEQNKIEKAYRNEVEAIGKAQRKAIKAKTHEEQKAEKVKEYKQFMANKLIKKMAKLNAKERAEAKRQQAEYEAEMEAAEIAGEISEGYYGRVGSEEFIPGNEKEFLTTGTTEPTSEETPRPEPGTAEPEEETKHQDRPADWFEHEYKPGDEFDFDVDVGTDTVPASTKPKPKMYNVAIQVNPKSKAQIYKTAPWNKDRPKMYNVSVGVGPSLTAHVISQEQKEQQRLEEEEKARLKAEERERRKREGYIESEEIPGEYYYDEKYDEEFQKLKPREQKKLRAERLRAKTLKLLRRTPSARADAMTQARPTYYRELPLSTSMEVLTTWKEIQVTEYDIEKEDAEARGIILDENNILWPTIKEFDVDIGERKLEDYIRRCWKLDREWMYHIRLLQVVTTDYRKKYIFEVIFSIPTKEAPVPAATASVFFVFEVLKYANIEDTIKVSYVLEATRYSHVPGHIPFEQRWLQGIVADKLRVQRSIDF